MIDLREWEQPLGQSEGVVFDAESRVLDASPQCLRRLGVTDRSRFVGHRLDRAVDPPLGTELSEIIRRHVDRRTPFWVSILFRGCWVHGVGTPVVHGDETPAAMMRCAVNPALLLLDQPLDGASVYVCRSRDLDSLGKLSIRELEVLKLIGDGLTSQEISEKLHRSVRTIQGHRRAIGRKLGTKTRSDLARIAAHAGLCVVPLDQLEAFASAEAPESVSSN